MRHILWIMGPTSSGKTTISKKLMQELKHKKIPAIHYDGDEVRNFFGDTLGFKKKDRLRVVKTIAHLSNKALASGLNVVVSALTANDDARSFIKAHVNNLKIIFIECSLDACIERDPKGLYKKAMDSKITTLAGFNTEYKPIQNPNIVINTEKKSIHENVNELLERFF